MKTVLLGITGCIAAYKACEVVRGLQKSGADLRVKVVMTPHACEFVGPTTFRALTREEVAVELFDAPSDPIHHISLAKEADVFCIAPCTANVLAKLAHGQADDLLTTTALAFQGQLLVAPAMNVDMWRDEATQENLRVLEARGVRVVSPEAGYLACGEVGDGRLAEPAAIVEAVLEECSTSDELAGQHVLVTAGPTHEPLDPVRYLANHSSGLQGFAIAREAARRGAKVTLVSGPTSLPDPHDVEVVRVTTAAEMLTACEAVFPQANLAVFSAAVCDWHPAKVSEGKLKRTGGTTLELVPNPDIAATLGANKTAGQRTVVFAAETTDPIQEAQRKLLVKNADLCVANNVASGLGFGTAENKVWFVTQNGAEDLPVMSKTQIARALFDRLAA